MFSEWHQPCHDGVTYTNVFVVTDQSIFLNLLKYFVSKFKCSCCFNQPLSNSKIMTIILLWHTLCFNGLVHPKLKFISPIFSCTTKSVEALMTLSNLHNHFGVSWRECFPLSAITIEAYDSHVLKLVSPLYLPLCGIIPVSGGLGSLICLTTGLLKSYFSSKYSL